MGWSERGLANVQPVVFPELIARSAAPAGPGQEGDPERAHTILRRAEAQAQALVEAARQKAAAQLQAGYREGQLQGRSEALAEGRERLTQLLTALAVAVARVEDLEQEVRGRSAELVITLAQEVARRILQAEIASAPEAFLGLVRATLGELPTAADIVVRVHPDQHAMLEQHRAALQEGREDAARLRVIGDPAIESGGCLVEAPGCLVDATIAVQLEEAARRLREGHP